MCPVQECLARLPWDTGHYCLKQASYDGWHGRGRQQHTVLFKSMTKPISTGACLLLAAGVHAAG